MLATLGDRGRDSNCVRAQSFIFLLWETWGVAAKCPDAISFEVDILYYNLAFFAFRRLIVISKREVLKTSYSIMFTVSEVDSITILYHIKEINWIGTHWRGTRRRSPMEGVNFIINFYLWLSSSFYCSLFLFLFLFHLGFITVCISLLFLSI